MDVATSHLPLADKVGMGWQPHLVETSLGDPYPKTLRVFLRPARETQKTRGRLRSSPTTIRCEQAVHAREAIMMEMVFSCTMQLAAAIRAGHVSATEVLEAHLTQIATHNPALNAVVTLD